MDKKKKKNYNKLYLFFYFIFLSVEETGFHTLLMNPFLSHYAVVPERTVCKIW